MKTRTSLTQMRSLLEGFRRDDVNGLRVRAKSMRNSERDLADMQLGDTIEVVNFLIDHRDEHAFVHKHAHRMAEFEAFIAAKESTA